MDWKAALLRAAPYLVRAVLALFGVNGLENIAADLAAGVAPGMADGLMSMGLVAQSFVPSLKADSKVLNKVEKS